MIDIKSYIQNLVLNLFKKKLFYFIYYFNF